MTTRAAVLGLLAVGAMASGCARLESRVQVRPDASAEMTAAFRVAGPLAVLLKKALGNQQPLPLPPGVTVAERDEGSEHVWELRPPGGLLNPATFICQVTREERLLTTLYHLTIDPSRARDLGSLLMLQGPTVRPALARVSGRGGPAVFAVADQKAPDLGQMLERLAELKGLLEAFGLSPSGGANPMDMLEQLPPALYAEMPGQLLETNGEQVGPSTARWTFDLTSLQPPAAPMTADSELPDAGMVAHLAERLTLHLGQEVAPELVADLVTRGLLPDPEVEDRSKAVLDLSVYGTLLTLAAGLDELIGAEKTDAVIEALGLIGEEPSLAEATKAAKRVPALAEVPEVRELSTEELVRRLQGG